MMRARKQMLAATMVTSAEEMSHAAESDTRDPPEVRARITEALTFVPMVIQQLRKVRFSRDRRDDLVSFGNEGALSAARTYDASQGVPFKRWATIRIRGALVDGLRAHGELSRRLHEQLRALEAANWADEGMALGEGGSTPASAAAADARLTDRLAAMATAYAAGMLTTRDEDVLEAVHDGRGTPEEEVARAELEAAVRAAIAERPEDERLLLERYYFEEQSMSEASGGLSRSWACRLHAQAIDGLAKTLRRARVVSRHGP
jgi:RNA polymerase sigma factor for flagellar operon FliA